MNWATSCGASNVASKTARLMPALIAAEDRMRARRDFCGDRGKVQVRRSPLTLESPLSHSFRDLVVIAGAFVCIAAQAFLAWGLIFHVMPTIGLDLLWLCEKLAGFN